MLVTDSSISESCPVPRSLIGIVVHSIRAKSGPDNQTRKVEMASDVTGDVRSISALVRALGDEDCYVRQEAASALGAMGDHRAVKALVELFEEDDDEDVRAEAACALGEIGNARAVESLIRALLDSGKDVRAEAAWALGRIRDIRAVEPLIQALKDEEEDVREEVVWSLGRIRNARAIELLNQAAGDKSAHVRRVAAEALANIGAEGALTNQLGQ